MTSSYSQTFSSVFVSLTQLVWTMHKICKSGVQTPATTEKNVPLHRNGRTSSQQLFSPPSAPASALSSPTSSSYHLVPFAKETSLSQIYRYIALLITASSHHQPPKTTSFCTEVLKFKTSLKFEV